MTTQELAQKILDAIEHTEQQLRALGIGTEDLSFCTQMRDDIKQLCQEEVDKRQS